MLNGYLENHSVRLATFIPKANRFKDSLIKSGFTLTGDEALKVTLLPKSYGYTGTEIAELLEAHGIFPEFFDPDHLVLMLTPETPDEWMTRVTEALSNIPRRDAVTTAPPRLTIPEKRMSIRKAAMAPRISASVEDSVGRVLASPSVGCPPAVPIVVSGEVISRSAVEVFRYFGIDKCTVVK